MWNQISSISSSLTTVAWDVDFARGSRSASYRIIYKELTNKRNYLKIERWKDYNISFKIAKHSLILKTLIVRNFLGYPSFDAFSQVQDIWWVILLIVKSSPHRHKKRFSPSRKCASVKRWWAMRNRSNIIFSFLDRSLSNRFWHCS